jgi:hypothetical protein
MFRTEFESNHVSPEHKADVTTPANSLGSLQCSFHDVNLVYFKCKEVKLFL